jgi:hypothetical protein
MGRVLGAHGFQIIRTWQPYWGTPYGSLGKFICDTPGVLANILGFGQTKISPPWPGNTYSLLARKTFLMQPLKFKRKWYQALLSRPSTAPNPAASISSEIKPT